MASRQPRTRFKDRAELLDFLLDVTSATASAPDLDSVLASVSEHVRRVTPCDVFVILLYSERRKGLVVRYSFGLNQESFDDLVIPLDEGLTGVAASSKSTVMVGDVKSDPRYLQALDAIQSELAVPMLVGSRLVGVLDLQSSKRNAFNNEDSALVQLIASRVASFLLRAKLFRRLERQNRTLRTLGRMAREFSSILDLDELLATIAARVRELAYYDALGILLHDPRSNLLRHRFSMRYDQRVQLDNIPFGRGITGAAAQSRAAVRVDDVTADARYIETSPGIRSEIAVPLIAHDELVGVMNLESERVGFFNEDHEQLLGLVAPQVASAIENARLYQEVSDKNERMAKDLAAARHVQSVLLPREDPDIHGLEIGIGFRPAHEITGDVFDFFEHGDDFAIISCGDVSGKSAAAALYGAMVAGLLRTLAPRRKTPSALMEALNDALIEHSVAGKYLTLLVLLWRPKSRMLTMSNAAAIPPMVCRGGEIISPHLEGFPLGMFPNRRYDETAFQAEPGDTILLYSDGIQDQQNRAKQAYGEVRLPEFFRGACGAPAKRIVDAILEDFDRFREDAPIQDDQTLVVLKVK